MEIISAGNHSRLDGFAVGPLIRQGDVSGGSPLCQRWPTGDPLSALPARSSTPRVLGSRLAPLHLVAIQECALRAWQR